MGASWRIDFWAGDGNFQIHFDVRGAGLHPQVKGAVANWGGAGPRGRLTANTCYLERDGKPLPIVADEVQFQRLPVEEWEPAIVQMKGAGLNTISSYVFWNQIERRKGAFDFSGRKHGDLLAPKHVFGRALEIAGVVAQARPVHFSAGWTQPCFAMIEEAGYSIIMKGASAAEVERRKRSVPRSKVTVS